jgi:hypothetical protein
MSDRCEDIRVQTDELDIKKSVKDVLYEMINELNRNKKKGGNRKTRYRSSKSRTLKKGGGKCNVFKIITVLSIFALALYASRDCLPRQFETIPQSVFDTIIYAIDNYKKNIINLFSLVDNFENFKTGKFSLIQFAVETFGKVNIHLLLLEKITSYYTRLSTQKRESIIDFLPAPLTKFLDIFCNLLDNPKKVEKAKEEVAVELKKYADPPKKVVEEYDSDSDSDSDSEESKLSTVSQTTSETIITKEGSNDILIENLKPGQKIKIHISDSEGFFDSSGV